GGVAADFAALFEQRVDDGPEVRVHDVLVDQQRLGGAADAGAPHLGVDGDLHRHVEPCRAVDIGVADALEVGEDGDARLFLDAGDECFAAAGDDDVDIAVEPAQHFAHGLAVGGGDDLDGV